MLTFIGGAFGFLSLFLELPLVPFLRLLESANPSCIESGTVLPSKDEGGLVFGAGSKAAGKRSSREASLLSCGPFTRPLEVGSGSVESIRRVAMRAASPHEQ